MNKLEAHQNITVSLAKYTNMEIEIEKLKAGIKAHAKAMDELMNRPPDFSRGQRIAKLLGELEKLATP